MAWPGPLPRPRPIQGPTAFALERTDAGDRGRDRSPFFILRRECVRFLKFMMIRRPYSRSRTPRAVNDGDESLHRANNRHNPLFFTRGIPTTLPSVPPANCGERTVTKLSLNRSLIPIYLYHLRSTHKLHIRYVLLAIMCLTTRVRTDGCNSSQENRDAIESFR